MHVVEVAADALVIRFAPWRADNVLKRAGLAYRRGGVHTASVFAGLQEDGETDHALRRRLLNASELHDINPEYNHKYDVCPRAGDLLDAGFVFMKDGDEQEAAEHYSVNLGDTPSLEDVERFLRTFTTRERRPQ